MLVNLAYILCILCCTYYVTVLLLGLGDTANFGIDPIPSKYRAGTADTNTDTFYWKIPDH